MFMKNYVKKNKNQWINTMDKETIVKILMFLSMLVLFFTILFYEGSDCTRCKFDYEGKKLNLNGFMSIYENECLQEITDYELMEFLE